MNLPADIHQIKPIDDFRKRLYSASQVRELDSIAINHFGISGFMLMQRAGQATFDALLQCYPTAQTLCVVCGSGNNGGDGYIIATLAMQAGLSIRLIQLGNPQSIKGDALLARNAFLQAGGKEIAFDVYTQNHAQNHALKVDIIVDAIFGTGLSRDITGHWKTAIEEINAESAKVIAVDIPSGLNADTGSIQGVAIKADLSVTYIGLKSGLFTGQAQDYCGEIRFNDLQVPTGVYEQLKEKPNKWLIPQDFLRQTLKPRSRCSHKGSHGHVLLIGGTAGMSGAICLAGEAALRTGAGLVSIATDSSHAKLINISRPELMVTGIGTGINAGIGTEIEATLRPLIEKATVIAIGPGLGQSQWAKQLLQQVLESNKPKVIDADALNLLAHLSWQQIKDKNWILTPHPAEAARLLGISTTEIENNRYQSILKIVKKGGGGYCILKGAGSLISDGTFTHVCTAGNPGMASGGMGDVLSGIVAALVAQGFSLADATIAAVQIHAQAADRAAQKGERGLLASDLFPFIRQLVNPSVNQKGK